MATPEVFLLCQGCLSRDRRCNLINETDLNVFLRIFDSIGESKARCQFLKSVVLCWECEATLRKFRAFQQRVQKAQNVLKNHYLLHNLTTLSTLKISTKTEYDADINKSLQFKEITITKIGADLKPIFKDTVKIKDEIRDTNNEDLGHKVKVENFEVHDHFDSDYAEYEYEFRTDDKPILDLKITNTVSKQKLAYNKNNDEDCNLFRRPRLKKAVDFKAPLTKFKLINKGARVSKNEQNEDLHFKAGNNVVSLGTSGITCLKAEPRDSEQDDIKGDPSFIPSASKRQKNEENKKFTKLQIDKDNVLQYFTEYTLSESEYREFLEKLSKTPYFMNSKNVCAKCVVVFVTDEDYLEHMKLHDSDSGIFSCALCELHFSDEQQFLTHITFHLTVHQCNICKQSCGLQHSISEHMATVHRGFLYKCRACGFLVETVPAMYKHINSLHKRLICNDCGKSHYKRIAMARHARKRHLVAICPICKIKFSTYGTLRIHLTNIHDYQPGSSPKKYKTEDMFCVECNKQYPTMGRFKTHVQDVHRRPKRRFPCPKCPKVLTKNAALRNHYNLFHGEGTKHKCEACNKYYVTAFALKTHNTRVHQKIPLPKTELCITCGRSFQTKKILIHHIRTHTGERPYECSHCDARFAQQYARDVHVRNQHLKHSQIFT